MIWQVRQRKIGVVYFYWLGTPAPPKTGVPKMSKITKTDAPAPTPAAAPIAAGVPVACLCYVNPKKVGSASHARFALYAQATTVQAYKAAVVAIGQPVRKATADLAWDRKHGFIKVG